MRRSRTPSLALGATLLALVLAACGSSSSSKSSAGAGSSSTTAVSPDSSTTTSGSAGTTPKNLCTVITPADAAAVFGESAETKAPDVPTPFVTGICFYHHPGDDLQTRNLLQIRIYPGEKFFSAKLFPNSQTVAGLGDRAFVHVNTLAHTVQVDFVKNGKTGSIFYSAGQAVDVPARTAAVEAVAKKLAGTM
jgi:hypothetical protein